jgi:hypothetical protein
MPKVWNKRDKNCPVSAIYVGRPSKWGNPFKIYIDGTRLEVIEKYRGWITTSRTLDPLELKGKDLCCWCKPAPCHADILRIS